MFEFLLLFCAYAWTESKSFLFYTQGKIALSAVQFTVPVFLGFTFHKTLELREKSGGFTIDEPPGGYVNEPWVLLQTAGTVQTAPTVIWMLWFYVSVYVSCYNYVQLARSVKWKSCSHSRPLRNKFTVSILRCRELLNTYILRQKNMEATLEELRNSHICLRAASLVYHLRKYTWKNTETERIYEAGFLLCSGTYVYILSFVEIRTFLQLSNLPCYRQPSRYYGQRVMETFPVNSALCHVHSGYCIVNIYWRYMWIGGSAAERSTFFDIVVVFKAAEIWNWTRRIQCRLKIKNS